MEQQIDELARAFQGGDRRAFDELARRVAGRLQRVGRRITGDAEEGDDVAQEALVKGYRSIGQWDGRGSIGGWLAAIAARCALDRLRRRRLPLEGAPPEQPAAQGDPLGQSLGAERRQVVERALCSLTDRQRAMVVLRHYEGLSQAEIAEVCGCCVGTVKSTLFQAFEKLRHKLAREVEP